jgi:hypothetical protein
MWYEARWGIACRFDSRKAVVISMPRLLISKHNSNCSTSQNMDHTTASYARIDLINQTDTSTNQLRHLPTQCSSIHMSIHAAHNCEHGCYNSLHSVEAVHIPHESWSSRVARYMYYRWAPLHTSGLCARTLLQGCSIVSSSLWRTH